MKFGKKEDDNEVHPVDRRTQIMMEDKNFKLYMKPRRGRVKVIGDLHRQTEFVASSPGPADDDDYSYHGS